jgi:hypothetical protein
VARFAEGSGAVRAQLPPSAPDRKRKQIGCNVV